MTDHETTPTNSGSASGAGFVKSALGALEIAKVFADVASPFGAAALPPAQPLMPTHEPPGIHLRVGSADLMQVGDPVDQFADWKSLQDEKRVDESIELAGALAPPESSLHVDPEVPKGSEATPIGDLAKTWAQEADLKFGDSDESVPMWATEANLDFGDSGGTSGDLGGVPDLNVGVPDGLAGGTFGGAPGGRF